MMIQLDLSAQNELFCFVSQASLPSKISPAPTRFSAPVPLPVENFDNGSTEEPEHPNMKENPLKESAPFLQEVHI